RLVLSVSVAAQRGVASLVGRELPRLAYGARRDMAHLVAGPAARNRIQVLAAAGARLALFDRSGPATAAARHPDHHRQPDRLGGGAGRRSDRAGALLQ